MQVRTRIAPSPTGIAHIGTAYAALFNFAFARRHQGKFILRIEDTDIKRNVVGAEKKIIAGLSWLQLNYDEGPYRQSERLEIYQKYAHRLQKANLVYQDGGALRLKVADSGETGWEDLVRGKIVWRNANINDFVLIKSNGYPTYNFAVVVDDIEMQISHVIRAEDHIPNTPRQLLLYQALDVVPPQFAHFPLLRNPDKSKISKRKNPVALAWYRQQGFLPEAVVNYLGLLGFSMPSGREQFTVEEFIGQFRLERIATSAPIFNLEKLEWLNGEYIRQMKPGKLATQISDFIGQSYNKQLIGKTIPLIQTRIKKLNDYLRLCRFFFSAPHKYERRINKKWIREVAAILQGVNDWQAAKLYKLLQALAEQLGVGRGKLFMAVRLAVTGKKVGPPLFESMEILGSKECLTRLKDAAASTSDQF